MLATYATWVLLMKPDDGLAIFTSANSTAEPGRALAAIASACGDRSPLIERYLEWLLLGAGQNLPKFPEGASEEGAMRTRLAEMYLNRLESSARVTRGVSARTSEESVVEAVRAKLHRLLGRGDLDSRALLARVRAVGAGGEKARETEVLLMARQARSQQPHYRENDDDHNTRGCNHLHHRDFTARR